VKTRNLVIRNNYVHHNTEDGLWFDIDNIDALIEGNRIVGNTRSGIHWEISYDAVIRNNYVEGNALGDDDMWHRGGIRISSSPNVEVYGNTLVNNRHGIVAINQNRGSGAFGEREIKNLYVHDNEIRQGKGVLSGLGIAGTGDPVYFSGKGNRWERNIYRVSDPQTARWHWQGGLVGWETWRSVHTSESLGSS
jgi:parallel beta-helix repeat protein